MRGHIRRRAHFLIFFVLLAAILSPFLSERFLFAASFEESLEGLERVEPGHVVRFQVLGMSSEQVQIQLETRGGFKIYDKSLLIEVRPAFGASWEPSFTSNPQPEKAHDPWYDEVRSTHTHGAVFTLATGSSLTSADQVRVRIEACSQSMCLLPVWFSMPAVVGALSTQAERAKRDRGLDEPLKETLSEVINIEQKSPNEGEHGHKLEPPDLEPSQSTSIPEFREAPKGSFRPNQDVLRSAMSLSDRVSLFVQEALNGRSVWLFPALFLAGLLMNLTPCVYPMIPITVNVLGRLGHAGSSNKESPFEGLVRASVYVLGMIVTYSLMGVVAGMTGTLFGSLLQSETVLVGLSVLFVVLGLGMIGVIDLSRVQIWASRIPISDRSPHIGVFTMGAVSGLVSAPCTGPVLSAILVLIGKSKDPLYGLSLMSFFSLGFGAPYLVLGLFAHNLRRLPRAGRLLDFVKVAFGALLFGLACYYLKFVIGEVPILQRAYENPGLQGAALCLAVCIIFWQISYVTPIRDESVKEAHRRARRARLGRIGLIVAMSQMSLWLTLFVTNGFIKIRPSLSSQSNEEVFWVTNWETAKAFAKSSGKGMLVDAWAEWCAACLEMDADLWPQADVVARVKEDFIAVKLDFTKSSPFSDEIAERWGLTGLPAVALFGPKDDFEGPPPILFRHKIEKRELFEAMGSLRASPELPGEGN